MGKTRKSNVLTDQLEKIKAGVHAKVEHPFRVIKCQFGYRKTRYRGLAKNTSQLLVLFGLSNLWMVRKRIIQGMQAWVRLQHARMTINMFNRAQTRG